MKKSNWKQRSNTYYKSFIQRFVEKIKINDETDCWEWIGTKNSDGYGNFLVHDVVMKAHRISYLIHIGEIPSGMCVCHHCDNPSCVNPDHLFLGTHTDNMRDMTRKRRLKIPKLRGENCGSAKLSDLQVKEMRDIYKNEEISTGKLGKMFGISQPQAWRIVKYISRD